MQNINPTVVLVAIIAAITILVGLFITRPVPNQPVTATEESSEVPSETDSLTPLDEEALPLNEGTPPELGEPIIEPGSPEDEPSPVACTMDAKQCPDGSYVGRVAPNCEFAPCPPPSEEEAFAPVGCTKDIKQCPDGSYVGREAPDCEFAACPIYSPNMQLQMQP